MAEATKEQIEKWRARWGAKDNPNDIEIIRNIVRIIQKTKENPEEAQDELIKYLKDKLDIGPIIENVPWDNYYKVPDLRGFTLNFLPEEERDLNEVQIPYWHLQSSFLEGSRFDSAYMENIYLESAGLQNSSLKSSKLGSANLQEASIIHSNLKNTELICANLQSASLFTSNLESANLSGANLVGTDLSYTTLKYAELIDANLAYADFSHARLGSTNFHRADIKNTNFEGASFDNKTNFIEISAVSIDWPGNRMLERHIKDQEFLYEFKTNHPKLYFWWNLTSRCGRSIPRLSFWVICVIISFTLIYHSFPVVKLIAEEINMPRFWAALYTSVNVFSNLGMGNKEPLNVAGSVLIMVETLLGFVALGLLLTVAGSRFARRS